MTPTSTANVAEIDTAKQEAFGGRMAELLNSAALSFMFSVGHRTGLLDALAAADRPLTSRQLADAAELNERYVREWLGALVTGRVVDYDPATKTHTLPAEHAAWLTRAATPNNLAGVTQFMAVFGKVEDDIVGCFRTGGGVPYERFDRFHEVMAEESAQTVVAALDEHIVPLVPQLRRDLTDGISVLDVGCGRGMAMMHLAARYPASRFAGYDFSEEAIGWATAEAMRRGLSNVRFEVRDAAKIGETARYDVVFAFDAIHDQIDPAAMLAGIHAALRDGGVFLAQDIRTSSYVENNIDHELGSFLYTISTMHCMTVSLAHCGCGLGTCWGEELANSMLRDAGFGEVRTHRLAHDIMNNYYVCRK